MSPRSLIALTALLLLACGRDDPLAESERDAAAADADLDGAPVDAALPEDSGLIFPDVYVPTDGQLPDAALPDAAVEVCNGEDDDGDGEVDEDVTNACGGCGPLPETGCQAWEVDLVQDATGTLDTRRVVGLLGALTAVDERDIEGAHCQLMQAREHDPEAHLGLVQLDGPQVQLNLMPTYNERTGYVTYAANPEQTEPLRVHSPGEVVRVVAGGSATVPAFELRERAPAGLAAQTGLSELVAQARGEAAGPLHLTWTGAGPAVGTELRLFVGGSVPLFANIYYRATRHYQLDAQLQDDGELSLPNDLFNGGVPESSVWAYLMRSRSKRAALGPHSATLVLGQRFDVRQSGRLQGEEDAPFPILEPSPNVRVVVPGEPLVVRWGPLPEGEGPLTVSLLLVDEAAMQTRQYACEVDDPQAGELVLPGDFTEGWPQGEGDVRILALRWGERAQALAAPDQGTLTTAVTVQLNLEP